ncbi:MAG: hypothetical protein VKJ02_16830 [Snowella sp.]|nr:hypothetical protein [Snowella sp.]
MADLTLISEMSRMHCVSICAFLVPAMLIATLQSILLVIFQRRQLSLMLSTLLSFSFIGLMVFHVSTWFSIGVITPITFILLSLSTLCLIVNSWLLLKFARPTQTLSFLKV